MKTFFCLLLFFPFLLSAQESKNIEPQIEESSIYTIVEVMPMFQGGNTSLAEYLSKQIRYPKSAAKANIQGVVYASFVVNQEGKINDITILRSPDDALSEEAMRVLQKMPNWIPGMQNGKTVNVKYNLPIRFKLD
jgi:protein TonB